MRLSYWSWIVMFLIPFLGLSYLIFPNGDTLVLGGLEISSGFWPDWSTFMWQLGPQLASAIIVVVLFFTLPKRTTPWQLIVVLSELLFLLVWNIEKMIAATRYINGHPLIVTILITTAVVGGVLLFWKRRQKTDREKKEALLAGIDQLTAEDLPALFLALKDVELTADEMKEHDFVWAWKQVLKNNVEYPKAITTAALQKFLELKAENA